MPCTDLTTETMLAEMAAVAHRLGMAFGREAEREADWKRKAELFGLFDRCFFGVRVAIALKLRLRQAARAAQAGVSVPSEDREADDFHERGDPPETERPNTVAPARERLDADRDREGDRASLPLLIKTLQGVAADAAALPGPAPAELPALTALLTRATGTGGPAKRPAPLRSRLSGAAVLMMPTPRAGPATGAFAAQALRPRTATGPPRR
jgi:hypothetical protein